uniref:Uncharacterized protein n=1 Tax=Arundo donax TaxID=35708 RepID=A0A0A9A061_ARUDO
MFISWKILL